MCHLYLRFNARHLIAFGLCLSMLTALWAMPVDALQPIDTLNTTLDLSPDTSGDYSTNGGGSVGSQNFPTDTTFDIRFNTHTGNLHLDSFAIGGITFMRQREADQLIVQRFGNAQTNPQRYRWYGEAVATGTTIDVSPSRVDTPEDILTGDIINRGVLDTFLNVDVSGEGANNIERIDILFTAGLVAPMAAVLNSVGFAVAEKRGNNPFQIAAITAVDGGGNPTAYGNIVLVTAADYGVTNVMATNIWFENDPFDNPPGSGGHGLPRPYNVLTESTNAVFISFQDVGIVEGQTFFGYSLFADDVMPGTHDLTDVSTFPQSTNQPNGGDHYGGFMSGLFSSPLPPIAVDDSATTPINTPVTFSATDNDTDLDGNIDPSTVDLDPNTPGQQTTFIVPGEGIFAAAANGDVTFIPEADFTGVSTIRYTVNDNEGFVSNVANLIVNVEVPSNTPPIAVNDSAITPLDTPVTFSATDNDTDPDGTIDPATVDLDPNTPGQQTSFVAAGECTFTVDTAGNVTFNPETGFTGISSIPYTVNDNDSATSNTANIIVTVQTNNVPPLAINDSAVTQVDTPVTFSVTANDTDIDGNIDPATVDLDPNTPGRQTTSTVPGEGTFTADDNGNVTFTPEAGFTGTSTIPYTVNDDDGATSNTANIIMTIQPVENAPPVAANDSANTPFDTPVTFSVTANDTDIDGSIDPATVDLDPNTSGRQTTFAVFGEGTFSADDDGNVTFTPEAGFTGTSTIPYTVNDDDGATSNPANIVVIVGPEDNAPPVAANDSANTPFNTPVTFSVTANDTDSDGTIDPATVDLDPNTPGRQTTSAVSGEGAFSADDDGNVTFTPEAGFTGTSTISYTVNDAAAATSNPANIAVIVEPEGNVSPVAANDSANTPFNTPVIFSITANDTDADGTIDPATVDLDPSTLGQQTAVMVPGEGVFTADNNGNVTFTPETDFTGTSTISYTVNDNEGATSNTADIAVTVEDPANMPPTAVDDVATTMPGTPVTIPVLDNDSDPDGDALVVTEITQPGSGVVTLNPDGILTYTPAPDTVGPVTFTYTISDGRGGQDSATVTVNLINVFDPPSGQKTVSFTGRPEVEWRMVWINADNVTANAVRVEDVLAASSTFINGSLTCEARGDSTVDRCEFEAAARRVVYEGVIAADPGAATEEQAIHEVVMTFRVTVPDSFSGTLANQGMANWDANGNGSPDDDIAGQTPAPTDDPTTETPGDATLINIPPIEDSPDNEEGDNPDEGGSEGDSQIDLK